MAQGWIATKASGSRTGTAWVLRLLESYRNKVQTNGQLDLIVQFKVYNIYNIYSM